MSKVAITTEAGSPITISADGTIKVENLPKGTDNNFNITYDLGNGQKITIGTMNIKIDSSGNVSLTSTLIDPYGVITDEATGKAIAGMNVTLYYANTDRNKASGKIPGTVVPLPDPGDGSLGHLARLIIFLSKPNINPISLSDKFEFCFRCRIISFL